MARSDWPEWIRASLVTHVATKLSGKTIYNEGAKRDTNTVANYFEERIQIHEITERSQGDFKIIVELNILIATTPTSNLYNHEREVGDALDVFTKEIELLKHGQGQPGTSLGCLMLTEGIHTVDFGIRKDVDVLLRMSAVDGRYQIRFSETDWA